MNEKNYKMIKLLYLKILTYIIIIISIIGFINGEIHKVNEIKKQYEIEKRKNEIYKQKELKIKKLIKNWEVIEKHAKVYNVNPFLIAAIIDVESEGNKNAISTMGAAGLMQIMPNTYKGIVREHNLKVKNIHDINSNINVGTLYISELVNDYGLRKGLTFYNGGYRNAMNYPRCNKGIIKYVEKVIIKKEKYETLWFS